jgi:hypothetical protein
VKQITIATIILGTIAVLAWSLSGVASAATVANGSFETGDFASWIATDKVAPFDPLAVLPAGTVTFFDGFLGPNVVIPSDGGFAANHGFDGGTGGGIISIAQDVGVVAAGDILSFDYRAGWDLLSFCSGCGTRTFDVSIEPAGGGIPLTTVNLIAALPGTQTFGPNSDIGPMSGSLDLTPFAGVDARVNFTWFMPDAFSGPANAQLDNVAITPIPEPTTMALLFVSLAALAGFRRVSH